MATDPGDARIDLQKNGPLRVTGLERLQNSRGEPIETGKVIALCRCGASRRKPFCDGTHASIGFTDDRNPDRVPDRLDEYSGREVIIRDNRGTCSHAAFCTDRLPPVWRQGVEPWIDPDGAGADAIVETVRMCPSGALSYTADGKTHTEYHDRPGIAVTRDGPYRVRGGVTLEGAEWGAGASREHYALCRCGHSRNKPFCDGSHWYAGFRDDEGMTIAAAARSRTTGSETWIEVARSIDLQPGEVKSIAVGTRQAALIRTPDGLHALDARCPHQGGPLAEGTICNGALRCPWHGYDFAVTDGRGVGNPLSVDTLQVRESEGRIEVLAPAPQRSEWTVSHVLAETLVEWGIDTVFGMVGHSNLGFAEALRVQEKRDRIRYFGVRHEGAAAFACSGYAKLTGRPAACLSIAGPGATNLLTGLWDARVDRAPVIALTGQVQAQVLGPGAFQEIDLASAFEAVTVFSQTVLPGSDPAELASLAVKNAVIRRDVSHLILPDDVQTLDAGQAGPGRPEGRVAPTAIAPDPGSVDLAMARLGRAKRPVIIVGYGARDGIESVVALAERIGAPVITTFKGKGLISDHHPLGGGVLGRSGTPVASTLMNESDLLIVFGASFAQHTGIDPARPIIQIDFDRMALGKFHPVDEPVWGDVAITARQFRDRLPEASGTDGRARKRLASLWAEWRREKRRREEQDDGTGINSARIFRVLSELAPEDAVIAVDVGNNTYSFGRYFECRRQSILMSGYLGSIGFGFPAALGAWAAAGDRRKIIAVAGDGGFGQYLGEFTTAVRYGMNVTLILINNNELGKISKEQRDGEWKVWQTGLRNPDFSEFARLCGGTGIRVEKAADLKKSVRNGLAAKGPAIVEILSDPLLT